MSSRKIIYDYTNIIPVTNVINDPKRGFLQLLSHRRTLHLLRNKLLTIPILLGRLLHRIFSIRHPLRKLVWVLFAHNSSILCLLGFLTWNRLIIWIILWLGNIPLQKSPLMWLIRHRCLHYDLLLPWYVPDPDHKSLICTENVGVSICIMAMNSLIY